MQRLLEHDERLSLLKELRSEKFKRHADRIRVILLLDQGWTYKKICEAFFIDEGTIANWRKRYKEGGLDRLFNDEYTGVI